MTQGLAVDTERGIRVGDHVRWAPPDMELNVIWEVVSETSSGLLRLRFDEIRVGRPRENYRTASRADCVLIAEQPSLPEVI